MSFPPVSAYTDTVGEVAMCEGGEAPFVAQTYRTVCAGKPGVLFAIKDMAVAIADSRTGPQRRLYSGPIWKGVAVTLQQLNEKHIRGASHLGRMTSVNLDEECDVQWKRMGGDGAGVVSIKWNNIDYAVGRAVVKSRLSSWEIEPLFELPKGLPLCTWYGEVAFFDKAVVPVANWYCWVPPGTALDTWTGPYTWYCKDPAGDDRCCYVTMHMGRMVAVASGRKGAPVHECVCHFTAQGPLVVDRCNDPRMAEFYVRWAEVKPVAIAIEDLRKLDNVELAPYAEALNELSYRAESARLGYKE